MWPKRTAFCWAARAAVNSDRSHFICSALMPPPNLTNLLAGPFNPSGWFLFYTKILDDIEHAV